MVTAATSYQAPTTPLSDLMSGVECENNPAHQTRPSLRSLLSITDLPTVILEPAVTSLQYADQQTFLPVDCLVTDSAPLASVTWIKLGQTSIYSTENRIMVGTNNTGEFLCTALNSVGPSLTASLTVQIKGWLLFPSQLKLYRVFIIELPRRLQLEAADYRSSVRLHFPLS